MDFARHHITELMNRQCRVMRNNGLGFTFLIATPQIPPYEVLAFSRRKVTQAKDAPPDALPTPSGDVVVLLAVGIASLKGLGSREIPTLRRRNLIQHPRVFLRMFLHLQIPYIDYKVFAETMQKGKG
jgi:hypothetical protein